MGTRAVTLVIDQTWDKANTSPLINMYKLSDGYPSGYGAALATFLANIVVVNGVGGGETPGEVANGAGCLAAQLVAHFKGEAGVGEVYLNNPNRPFDALINDGDDCVYAVYTDVDLQAPENRRVRVEYYSWGKLKFRGYVDEFAAFVNSPDADNED